MVEYGVDQCQWLHELRKQLICSPPLAHRSLLGKLLAQDGGQISEIKHSVTPEPSLAATCRYACVLGELTYWVGEVW